jgi:GAF domain-containing protein
MDDGAAELAEMFGEVARQLLNETNVNETLQRIVELANEHLDGAECVGVSIVAKRRIESPASTGEMARSADRIQQEVDDGPCLEALREHESLIVDDLSTDERWPKFASRAAHEQGIRSMMSIRLFAREDTLGALNVYSSQVEAFDEEGLALASIFATHAAVALSHAQQQAGLEHKAETRDLIGQAKGILMSSRHVSEARAFELLREASQRLNLKLTQVADQVTFTGDLP